MKKQLLASLVAVSMSSVAFAEEAPLSYTYAGVSYQLQDVDGEDFSGLGVYGSGAINETFFGIGSYSRITSDDSYDAGFGPDEITFTQLTLGLGAHTSVSDKLDLFGTLAYTKVDAEFSGVSADGNGYILGVGARLRAADNIELSTGIAHSDIEDETSQAYSLSGRLFVNQKVSFGLTYVTEDDVDGFGIDARINL